MTGAVWRASRAAVKRRRVQTIVIGLVVFCSTATVLLALAVISAARAPFDDAFDAERGAHVAAAFDPAKASAEQLAATAHRPGVEAAAGPFDQAVVEIPTDWVGRPPGPLTLVGRADQGGPVDRVRLLAGRWATAPGEVVVNNPGGGAGAWNLGYQLITSTGLKLTVVGFATDMSQSSGGWVTPAQAAALHPTARQMLYRFTDAATEQQLTASLGTATEGLPKDAVASSQSYLVLKQAFSAGADAYLPLMTVFGVLGLIVAALIVGNVVSGAVVSGYRHIGVLKSIGFTPRQVVMVYLTMVSVPAVVGTVLGTAAGWAAAYPILETAFSGISTGAAVIEPAGWLPAATLLSVPLLVALAALVPASRAHRLSAAQAISAGSAPRTGRGLKVQRWLSGTRLPRAVSLGLGQPFARPARTALTMAAIVLGVVTVTVTTGVSSTLAKTMPAPDGRTHIDVQTSVFSDNKIAPRLTPEQTEAMLHATPGAERVSVRGLVRIGIVGQPQPVFANFYGGDAMVDHRRLDVVEGRPATGLNEVEAGPAFLDQHGVKLGDRITLVLDGRQTTVTVVGEEVQGNANSISSNDATRALLTPDPHVVEYDVRLADGTDAQAYQKAVTAADPSLSPSIVTASSAGPVVAIKTFSTTFSVLLSVVAALGVFNTLLLTIRERRRDLGMLKSIGMTPRQVVAMTVTSVAWQGVVSGIIGIPVGMMAHRLIVENVRIIHFPEATKDVWGAPLLTGLALAGVVIAVLGALVPARSAARLPIAEVLHNE
ncbi:putative ABC transport system permease protein [Kitasatospora sp. MAA19]|uniref:ABC transporter permease n=1 Tax=Kitasatospora sp. MAA19 TaxID=3035090 RepID=UPI00247455A1|nr:ABC transporter permease [Kitasatospora sp. MAA19]MDH6703992.1 putative ABC transport system permease protein [Kitasatospora sp. MAA19]